MTAAPNAIWSRAVLALLCAISIGIGHAASAAPAASSQGLDFARIAQPGPWSGISQFIVYRSRLWFVNSVPFQNFNAADIYSLQLATGEVRYERHLFSQDAGQPTVFAGNLYWPFEDSRASAGHGEFMITDGARWRWREMNATYSFHAHAMLGCGDHLLAASSAWAGGIQMSRDGGVSWTQSFLQDTPKGRVSRVISLARYAGGCYAGMRAYHQRGPKLLQWQENQVTGVPGSESIDRLDALTAADGLLFGIASGDGGQQLMRYDGQLVQYIKPPEGHALQALASANGMLYAVSSTTGGGALWRLDSQNGWHLLWRVDGEMPIALAVCGTRIFIGTFVTGGAGALWGSAGNGCGSGDPAASTPPDHTPAFNANRTPNATSLASHLARLDESLTSAAGYEHRALAIRERLEVLIELGGETLGNALSERLHISFPNTSVQTFSSRAPLPAAAVARHYLLRAIGLVGHGRVPPEFLLLPWIHADNRAQKYFDPLPLALWSVGILGQSDEETVAALMKRLGRPGDPPWLQADVVGALNALGTERYGHDTAAWRQWWAKRQKKGS